MTLLWRANIFNKDMPVSSVKGPVYSIFDFIGFAKMSMILKKIMVIRTKFVHILTNIHKILIKYS